MKLFDRFKAVKAAFFGDVQYLSKDDGWLIRAIGGAKTHAGVAVSEATALRNAAVWACATLIADVMCMLPIEVLRQDGKNTIKQPEHPLTKLLNESANEEMGSEMVVGTLQLHTLLWGNGYAEIEKNRRGETLGLWPLLPDRTRPEVRFPNNRRELTYRTTINAIPQRIPRDRVLHVMGYSHDGICGISPIMLLRQSVGLSLAMEEFGAKFFGNDAKSGGFLMHPGKLGEKAVENITKSFEEERGQGGLKNAHKVKILEEGMKFVPTTTTPEDSQFIGSREFQLAEVARIYRVPLVLLQSLQGSTVWGTGIESLMIGFATWTLSPWFKRWEQELARKILTEEERAQGFYLKFNANALLRGDMAARAAFYKAGITDGWMLRSEARDLEDMNPIEGLDEPLMQSNMQLASQAGQEGNDASGNSQSAIGGIEDGERASGTVLELARLVPGPADRNRRTG